MLKRAIGTQQLDLALSQHNRSERSSIMLGWALTFLVVALIAAVLGSAAERSVISIEQLKADVGITAKLGDFGMTEADINHIAAEAMLSGNVPVNPRQPTLDDMQALLRAEM